MAIPQMALIYLSFQPWYAADDLPVTFSGLATAGHCPSSTAIPLVAPTDFSLASVIPLMTW